jgi:hypothetical protein
LRSTSGANASTKTEGVTKIAVIFAIRSRKKGETRVRGLDRKEEVAMLPFFAG